MVKKKKGRHYKIFPIGMKLDVNVCCDYHCFYRHSPILVSVQCVCESVCNVAENPTSDQAGSKPWHKSEVQTEWCSLGSELLAKFGTLLQPILTSSATMR